MGNKKKEVLKQLQNTGNITKENKEEYSKSLKEKVKNKKKENEEKLLKTQEIGNIIDSYIKQVENSNRVYSYNEIESFVFNATKLLNLS